MHVNLGCRWVYMGVYGCFGVCAGALGYTNTNAQANNTNRDINRLAGYNFRPHMAGKFRKKDTCVCAGIKWVKKVSGGWGWVQMVAGGCIYTQQTKKTTNRDTDRRAGHNFRKVVGGKIAPQA